MGYENRAEVVQNARVMLSQAGAAEGQIRYHIVRAFRGFKFKAEVTEFATKDARAVMSAILGAQSMSDAEIAHAVADLRIVAAKAMRAAMTQGGAA